MKRLCNDLTRFWEKVDERGPDDCWLWRATVAGRYGQFSLHKRERIPAHRFAYELLVGPIPQGLVLDHLCRNTLCVNPAHLEPVTNAENTRRGISPIVKFGMATHCVNGHEFTPENTGIRRWRAQDGRPGRYCRACHRIAAKRARDRAA